jgi:hypothetical protein
VIGVLGLQRRAVGRLGPLAALAASGGPLQSGCLPQPLDPFMVDGLCPAQQRCRSAIAIAFIRPGNLAQFLSHGGIIPSLGLVA